MYASCLRLNFPNIFPLCCRSRTPPTSRGTERRDAPTCCHREAPVYPSWPTPGKLCMTPNVSCSPWGVFMPLAFGFAAMYVCWQTRWQWHVAFLLQVPSSILCAMVAAKRRHPGYAMMRVRDFRCWWPVWWGWAGWPVSNWVMEVEQHAVKGLWVARSPTAHQPA